MSTKIADKPKCKSAQSVESSVSLECTIKPSDKFLHVFELSDTFSTNRSTLNDKEIKAIVTKMDKLYNEVTKSKNAKLNDIITLAYCYQNLCHGYIQSNQKEGLRIGKTYILRCLNLVKDKELDSKSIIIALKGYYQLGFIYFKQKKSGKALQTCNKAIELYFTYTYDKEKYGNPINFGNIIIKLSLDGYYLINVIYGEILRLILESYLNLDNHNFIIYSHLRLAVDLNMLQETGKHLLWIQSALRICVYLIIHDRLAEARNHIITAVYVKNLFLHEMPRDMKEQEISSKERNLSKLDMLFIISRIRYGIKVLRRSMERLLRLEKGEEFEIDNLNSGHPIKLEGDIPQRLLLFSDICTEIPFTSINPSLPVKYISHYNDAYKIFTNTLWNVSISRFFFDKCTNIKEYGKLILDSYEAYKYMALYENNVTNRCLLQNMIIVLLSKGIKNKFLLTHDPVLYCNIKVHLAISYSNLIDIQLENLYAIHPLYMPQKYNTIELEIECLVKDAMMSLKMTVIISKDNYINGFSV